MSSAAPPVVEFQRFGSEPARLLLEVPHGATSRVEYDAVAAKLRSPLPARLEKFFHVNTDFGAPELAAAVARRIAAAPGSPGVLVARATIPRTFVDLNRALGEGVAAGMTPGLPPYVADPGDRERLFALHRRYLDAVTAAYEEVMAARGLAVALHTFAPRTVDVAVDAEIVPALEAAYRPGVRARWPLRPPVDLITRDGDGRDLAPPGVAAALASAYGEIGVDVAENATYHLHPATTGFAFAARWPGRVLCVEFRRDLLGSPWRPFEPSRAGLRKVARLAAPLARVLDEALAREATRGPASAR